MANSKYEYVKKEYESKIDDEVDPDIVILVRLLFRKFQAFSDVHGFQKPNDVNALGLMNECAKAVLRKFPEVVFSYGFRDEYSFVFKKETGFYQRRETKINSIVVSFFSSVYVAKWNEFFPKMDLRLAPSFQSRVVRCSSLEMLQAYLVWRQNECHLTNLYDTCLWQFIKSGKLKEAEEFSKEKCGKRYGNDLLYESFNMNYAKDVPAIFRQGTCTLKTEVEEIVKIVDGCPVKNRRRKIVVTVHSKNIASREFWNGQRCLVKELGEFTKDTNYPKPKYLKSFQRDTSSLAQSNWIVVRIDGCHFHEFSDSHEFEKPNDARALNLMNACAIGVLEKFEDVVFCYGVSDEYSFVLKKDSTLCERRASGIVSEIVSLFTSMYIMKWKEFFPDKNMKYPPYFDGRAVCYPSYKILRDYLSWRQVDCHINNQYNTCFWMLVKSGKYKTKTEAQELLEGTQTEEKNTLLDKLSGVCEYYNTLPLMFRHGSSVFWKKEEDEIRSKSVVVMHVNIIEARFWKLNEEILSDEIPSSPKEEDKIPNKSVLGIAICMLAVLFMCFLL